MSYSLKAMLEFYRLFASQLTRPKHLWLSHSINNHYKSFLRRGSCLLIATCLPGLFPAFAADLALNRNEFTRQLYTAKLWLQHSAEFGPEVFVEGQRAGMIEKWESCDNTGKAVVVAWENALKSDPLIQKAIDCANLFSDRELQAQTMRVALQKRYGREAFNQKEKTGKEYQKALTYSYIDLEDTELVRLYLWAGDLGYRISQQDTGTTASAIHPWLSNLEPFDAVVSERGAPTDEREAIEVFRLGAEIANAKAESQIDTLDASGSVEPEMLTYLRLRQEADILAFMGQNYLASELPKNEAISQAENEFNAAFAPLISELPKLTESLQSFQLKDIEVEAQRTAELYEEHKIDERSPAMRRFSTILLFNIIAIMVALYLWRKRVSQSETI